MTPNRVKFQVLTVTYRYIKRWVKSVNTVVNSTKSVNQVTFFMGLKLFQHVGERV